MDSKDSPEAGTLLIVDDQATGRQAFKELLEGEDLRLVFGGNEREGLLLAREIRPDLVLIAMAGSKGDGLKLCRRIRSNPQLADIPVALAVDAEDGESRLRGLEEGADDLVTRPFDPHELRGRIRALMSLGRARRLRAEQEKFEGLVRNSPNGIAILDEEGTIHHANPALRELLGVPDEMRLEGRPIGRYLPEEDGRSCMQLLGEVAADPDQRWRFEAAFLRSDGSTFPGEVDVGFLSDRGKPLMQFVLRDVSERKKAQDRIREQMKRLETLRSIGIAITANLDLGITLDVLLENAIQRLGLSAARAHLMERNEGVLVVAANKGFEKDREGELPSPAAMEDLQRALDEKRVVVRTGKAHDWGFRPPKGGRERILTCYSLPLVAKDQVRGVLELFQRRGRITDPHWMEFLEQLGHQAAIAIDNAFSLRPRATPRHVL